MAEAMETEAPGLEATNADPCQGTRHVVSTVSGCSPSLHRREACDDAESSSRHVHAVAPGPSNRDGESEGLRLDPEKPEEKDLIAETTSSAFDRSLDNNIEVTNVAPGNATGQEAKTSGDHDMTGFDSHMGVRCSARDSMVMHCGDSSHGRPQS